MSKRKRNDEPADDPTPTPILRIQACEADLVHDRPNLAELVQMEKRDGGKGGLIRWGDDEEEVWVDRFDARLLLSLSDLFSLSSSSIHEDPLADIGWSDLPSDTEDMFFFTPRQVAEYRHQNRMKDMEQGRLDRLKALAERDGDDTYLKEDEEAKWGGSDEEPDDAQLNLMTRTAVHILASPNPTQLEMRILANHGADPRFAFLRGRWKRAWGRTKNESGGGGKNESGNREKAGEGIGGLAGYASESESESEQDEEGKETKASETPDPGDVKAERRARAQEWMRKRKEERELAQSA